MVFVATRVDVTPLPLLLRMVAAFSALHLLLVFGEISMTHATAHARLAAHEMTRGRFALFFRVSVLLVLAGCVAPWIGIWASPAALAGVLAFEHAWVQAGQAVPLA
jgi:hypothetical protein